MVMFVHWHLVFVVLIGLLEITGFELLWILSWSLLEEGDWRVDEMTA
jgi:hypothetical protein